MYEPSDPVEPVRMTSVEFETTRAEMGISLAYLSKM